MQLQEKPIFQFTGPFGLNIQVMPSILILLVIFVGFGGLTTTTILFAVLIILSILLHEIGHGWGCYIQGVPVARLVLFGGGGFCQPARSTTPREDELIVAMGPIVTIALWIFPLWIAPYTSGGLETRALYMLSTINMFLAIFNLLPVMPLDGGKLLQLLLLRFMDARMATKICGGIGLVMCVLWLPAMVLGFLYLGFVLFFIPSIRLHWQMWNVR